MGLTVYDVADGSPATVDEFHVALTEDSQEKIHHSLFEDDRFRDLPERGIICILRQSTGEDRVTYLIEEIVEPESGDMVFDDGFSFDREYAKEARSLAETRDCAGLLYLHTHFPGGNTPSKQDTDVARESLFRDARKLGDDRPMAMGVVTTDGEWSVLSYEFDTPSTADEVEDSGYSEDAGHPRQASAVRVVGCSFSKLPTDVNASGAAGATAEPDMEAHDSVSAFWGRIGQARLSALRVGIVGLGGGGSILAPTLARLGVDELVLVDFDRIDHANLNRAMGATNVDADVHRQKVEVAGRNARAAATNENFTVRERTRSMSEDMAEHGALPDILDCDIIFNAADADDATRVLDEISHAHLIPVIDGGTNPQVDEKTGTFGEKGNLSVSIAGPGHPCLECIGYYTDESANHAQEPSDMPKPGEYGVEDALEDDNRMISMMPLNLVVAGLMQLRLLDLVLGICGGNQGEMKFRPLTWQMKHGLIQCNPKCDRDGTLAAGDSVSLSLGTDWKFKEIRLSSND